MCSLGFCSDVEGSAHCLGVVGGGLQPTVVQGCVSVLRNKDKHDTFLTASSLLLPTLSSVRSPLNVQLNPQ